MSKQKSFHRKSCLKQYLVLKRCHRSWSQQYWNRVKYWSDSQLNREVVEVMANHLTQPSKSRLNKFKSIYYILIIFIAFLLLFVTILSHYYLNSINSLPNFESVLNRNNFGQNPEKSDSEFDIYFKNNNNNQKNVKENGFRPEESISVEIKCNFENCFSTDF